MKIKNDFITNSSSTNYIVIETWEMKSGDMQFYSGRNRSQSMNITKQFLSFINDLTPYDEDWMLDFSVSMHDDHLQLSIDEAEECIIGEENDRVDLWDLDLTLNAYDNKSWNCSVHYTCNFSAYTLNKAIDLLLTKFIKMFNFNGVSEVEIERRVMDCPTDGWDGGDPMGYYAYSDQCRGEVDCKRILIIGE